MGPAGMPPPLKEAVDRVSPPKGLRDVPRFLHELLSGFFMRLGYTFRMVWKTGPWILLVMIVVSLLEGLLPVAGSLLSKEILNELQHIITQRVASEALGVPLIVTFWGLKGQSRECL